MAKVKKANKKILKNSLLTRLTRLAVIPTIVVGIVVTALAIAATTVSYNTVYADEALALAESYAASTENIVSSGLSTDMINKVIEKVHFGEKGLCFIVDKDGQIINTSSEEIIPIHTNLADTENLAADYADLKVLSAKMLAKESGTCHADICGEKYFIGYVPVEGTDGWSIAVATTWKPVVDIINGSAIQILVMALVAVIIVIIVLRFPIKKIAAPISATAERLIAFSEGDISSPAPKTNMGGEIQYMTEALGDMIVTMETCIGDIKRVLTSMADGDFTVITDTEYKGEFGEIKSSLDHIRDSLNQTMSEVGRSSSEVRDGAEQLAEGSTQLSQNAVTQAAAVDEITSTVMDIARKTEANSENVVRALETVQHTNERAQEGARSMSEMLEAINEIESSSKEIEQIMKAIDDIAFQTNILALNAAIEAARAGDAGKGFAVVADEVRNLAGKSAEAAQQTGELIGRSIAAVTRGTELADATSEALDSIVNGVSEISEVMTGIASANAEQNAAVEQISSGMENVNAAIHNTTATAEQSAAASEELSALAVSLSDAVSRFKTE